MSRNRRVSANESSNGNMRRVEAHLAVPPDSLEKGRDVHVACARAGRCASVARALDNSQQKSGVPRGGTTMPRVGGPGWKLRAEMAYVRRASEPRSIRRSAMLPMSAGPRRRRSDANDQRFPGGHSAHLDRVHVAILTAALVCASVCDCQGILSVCTWPSALLDGVGRPCRMFLILVLLLLLRWGRRLESRPPLESLLSGIVEVC